MNAAKFHRVVIGPFDANCVIVEDPATKDAIIVDPGGNADLISERVRLLGVKPTMVVFTHGHLDHCAEGSAVASMYSIPVAIHAEDVVLYENLVGQIETFLGPAAAARYRGAELVRPTVLLAHGDRIKVGSQEGRVIHLPGHSRGGIGLYFEGTPGTIVQGDTLFRDGVGRTDLFGGDWQTLLKSIRERLFTLPDDTRVICGHGGDTTIGREKAGFSW